jgi:hypothetical protein
MTMDLNDVDYDAYLANDRTLADPEVVRVAAGRRFPLAAAPAVDNSLEARLSAINSLPPRKPDLVHRITLSR